MTVHIELDGQRRAVQVRRDGGRWLVTVDGRSLSASIAEIGGRWSVLIGARSYEVGFESRGGGDHVVHVNGRPIPLSILEPRVLLGRGGHDGGRADDGPTAVAAPMPGRVVKVLVRAGDTVAARQGVVVVEAMKMENELRAPRAGIVAEVRAAEGTSVEAGAVLLVLE